MKAPETIYCPGLRWFIKQAASQLGYDAMPLKLKALFWVSVPVAFRKFSAEFPLRVRYENCGPIGTTPSLSVKMSWT